MNCLPLHSGLGFLRGGSFSWLSETWVMSPIVINIHIYSNHTPKFCIVVKCYKVL